MPTESTSTAWTNPPTALPRFRTRQPPPLRVDTDKTSLTILLLKDGALMPPSSQEVREVLMGFTSGDAKTGNLSPSQRNHVLGQCTDLNLLHWTLDLASTSPSRNPATHPREAPDTPSETSYTFS